MNSFQKNLFVCWFGVFTTSMGLSQLVPILPLYIRELGVNEYDKVAFYSGLSFGITSLLLAFFAPLWGQLSTRFGCKIMLLRASFGMAVLTLLLAFVNNVEQIIWLRALTGLISGFISTAVILVATIAPKEKTAWALGLLSTASVSGNLIGPLFGGLFAEFVGIRATFICIAFLLFISFLTILFFIKEEKINAKKTQQESFSKLNLGFLFMLFMITFIVQVSFNAVVPIMTLFVEQIHHSDSYIAFYTGLVVAASGLSNIIFAAKIGKMADSIGAQKVIIFSLLFCGVMFYLQSIASDIFTLIILRLLLGLALGGLIPCVSALFKKNVSQAKLGLVFGFNQSAFALGNFIGATGGGFIAGALSIEAVFHIAGALLIVFAFLFLIFYKKSFEA